MKNKDQFFEFLKRFPTGDNTQPWEFRQINENEIEVLYDEERARHDFNKSNLASKISFGFFKEYLRVGAEFFDLKVEMDFKDYRSGFLRFNKVVQEKDEKLFSSLDTRHVDRRKFDKAFSEKEINSLHLDNGTTVVSVLDFSKEFKKYCLKAEKRMWVKENIFSDFIKWIHLSESSYVKSKDGMLYSQVQIKLPDLPLFLLLKKVPQLATVFFKTPMYLAVEGKIKRFYENSHFLIYTVKDFEQESINSKAKTILSDWGRVNGIGGSYCPMNIMALPFVDNMLFFKDGPEKQQALENLEFFKNQMGIQEWPIWVARVGVCNSPYPYLRTLRR